MTKKKAYFVSMADITSIYIPLAGTPHLTAKESESVVFPYAQKRKKVLVNL